MEMNTKHGLALLDDADASLLDGWVWWSQVSTRPKGIREGDPRIYVVGRISREQGWSFPLHRRLLGMARYIEDPRDVDHINGDGLDNRRANLRITTRAQNLANTGSREGTSTFKGVSFEKQTRRWKAQITVDGRSRSLGRYDTQQEAALVYNAAAIEAWGSHAQLNDVPDGVIPVRKPRATSGFRGVSFDQRRNRWIVQLMIGGRQHRIGQFDNEIEAALAYNAAAQEALGDRARLNVIPSD